jgi:hypothetical protein
VVYGGAHDVIDNVMARQVEAVELLNPDTEKSAGVAENQEEWRRAQL